MPERILICTDLDCNLLPNGEQTDYLWKIDAMRLSALYIFLMLCFIAIRAASATTYTLPENPDDTVITHYPDNLALPGYRIHGSAIDKYYGIGMQVSHGCVRLYPRDIEALYHSVDLGTPVYIVKQPVKVGWLDNTLYIEAHPDLDGENTTYDQRYATALGLIKKAVKEEMPVFDRKALNQALLTLDGEPVAILRIKILR